MPSSTALAIPVPTPAVLPLPAGAPWIVPDGIILTRDTEAALWAAYIAGGRVSLTALQVLAILGTPPSFPSTLPAPPDESQAAYGFDLEYAV